MRGDVTSPPTAVDDEPGNPVFRILSFKMGLVWLCVGLFLSLSVPLYWTIQGDLFRDGARTCRDKPLARCWADLDRESFEEAIRPRTYVSLAKVGVPLQRTQGLEYVALDQLEWAALHLDGARVTVVRLHRVDAERVWVLSEDGLGALPIEAVRSIEPLGRPGSEAAFPDDDFPGLAGAMLTWLAVAVGWGLLQLLRFFGMDDEHRSFQVLSPVAGHRLRLILKIVIEVLIVVGVLAGLLFAGLFALLKLAVVAGAFDDKLVDALVIPFLFGGLVALCIAWVGSALMVCVEVASGIDFDIPARIRGASQTVQPLEGRYDQRWLRLSDIKLLRDIAAEGTVAALLRAGMRTEAPLFVDAGDACQRQRDHNEGLVASVSLLVAAGFLVPLGRGHRVTEEGLRLIAMPEFYSRPQAPAQVMFWVAAAERALQDSPKGGNAMVELLPELEGWLVGVVSQLVLDAPDRAAAIGSLYTSKLEKRALEKHHDQNSWRQWLDGRLRQLGHSDANAAALLKWLWPRELWTLRLAPVDAAPDIAGALAEGRKGCPLPASRMRALFAADLHEREGRPSGLSAEDVRQVLRDNRKNTLGSLFEFLRKLLHDGPDGSLAQV